MGLEWISLFCVFSLFAFLCRVCNLLFFALFFGLFLFLNWVFSAHFQAFATDCPSVFGHGENCKKLQKRNFAPTPSTLNPVRNFARSFFKTQTQRSKPWADQWYKRGRHCGKEPAHNKNESPKLFWCNVATQNYKLKYFRLCIWMSYQKLDGNLSHRVTSINFPTEFMKYVVLFYPNGHSARTVRFLGIIPHGVWQLPPSK